MNNGDLYELHIETLEDQCKKHNIPDWYECLAHLIKIGDTEHALWMVDSLAFIDAFEHDYLNE